MTDSGVTYRTDPRFFLDNVSIKFGTGGDSRLYYDGTDLVVSPAVVGTGDLKVAGASVLLDSAEGIDFGGGDVTLTHSAGVATWGGDGPVVVTHGSDVDLSFTGTTGSNDITLTDSLADALSITRGGTDMMVFDTSTPRITITPAVTITGALTLASNLTVADGGTGAGTFTEHGVMLGSGTGALSVTAVGSSGQVLTSNGAGNDPTFQAGGGSYTDAEAIAAVEGEATLDLAGDVTIADDKGLVIGGGTFEAAGAHTPEFQMHDTSPAGAIVYLKLSEASNDNRPGLYFGKSRGTTIGAFDAVADGTGLWDVFGFGADGTDMANVATAIRSVVRGTVSANVIPSELTFWTTTTGGTLTKNVEIANDGGVFAHNLLAAAASTDLNVNGSQEIHSVTSSSAFKENERPLELDTTPLDTLPLKTWDWAANSGSAGLADHGAIVEDIAAVIPELVNFRPDYEEVTTVEESGFSFTSMEPVADSEKPYSIRTQPMILALLDRYQKLNARVTELEP